MRGFIFQILSASHLVSFTEIITWLLELRYRKETESLVLCTSIHSWYLSRRTVVSFFWKKLRNFGLFWPLSGYFVANLSLSPLPASSSPLVRSSRWSSSQKRWGYWEVLPAVRTGRSRVPAVPHQVCPVCKLPNLSIKMSQICQISLLPLPTKDRLRVADT